jgi:hypothetical protein
MAVIASELWDHVVASFFQLMRPYLDEKLIRLSAGALALAFDAGAVGSVAVVSGLAASTVGSGVGVRDLRTEDAPTDRIRRPGAGRHRIEQVQPGLWAALDELIEPEERGDPDNPLRWTVKSTRVLADELGRQGHPVSHTVVAGCCASTATAFAAPRKCWKAWPPTARTATGSSGISTTLSAGSWPRAIR